MARLSLWVGATSNVRRRRVLISPGTMGRGVTSLRHFSSYVHSARLSAHSNRFIRSRHMKARTRRGARARARRGVVPSSRFEATDVTAVQYACTGRRSASGHIHEL